MVKRSGCAFLLEIRYRIMPFPQSTVLMDDVNWKFVQAKSDKAHIKSNWSAGMKSSFVSSFLNVGSLPAGLWDKCQVNSFIFSVWQIQEIKLKKIEWNFYFQRQMTSDPNTRTEYLHCSGAPQMSAPHHADFGLGRNGQIPAEEEKIKNQGKGAPIHQEHGLRFDDTCLFLWFYS